MAEPAIGFVLFEAQLSDIETAVKASRQIEDLLEQRFGAKGRGLHEKLTSAQDRLPEHILRRARYIASVRNTVVHDHNAVIKDRSGFEAASTEIITFLSAPRLRPAASPKPTVALATSPRDPVVAVLSFILQAAAVVFGFGLLGFAIVSALANMPESKTHQNTTGPARPVQLPQIGQ
jgi:hypothetical protein